MEKRLLFIISESYPFGRAYASRTRAMTNMFLHAGYAVTVMCDYIEGIENYECRYPVEEALCKKYSGIKKLIFLPRDYARYLDNYLSNNHTDIVVARSMFDRHDLVLRVVKKHKIPFILESCEWYDPKTFLQNKNYIRYYQFKHCWEKSYNKVDGVIAISRLLQEHYSKKEIPTVRIPGILETDKIKIEGDNEPPNSHQKNIQLIYSGDITGGKEELSSILTAIEKLRDEKNRIIFHIYGPSEQQVISAIDADAAEAYKRNKNIIIHGRIPQEKMQKAIQECDYGIFLRPNRRSSNAGFPTKLGEYLASGLPVITNDTGDIALIIRNNQNGFLLGDTTEKSVLQVLQTISNMSEEDKSKMKRAARISAESLLDPKGYSESIRHFLDSFGR